MDSSSSKGVVIGVLIALLIVGGVIGFFYIRRKRLLQAALEREHQGRPLID
jgi:LPXTG-motif cell wall-anchored protein